MNINRREYQADQDFVRVRDFLSETCSLENPPINWRIERWNYARYFVIPFFGNYGKRDQTIENQEQAIDFWEKHIGLWDDNRSQIMGLVATEYPDYGSAFLMRRLNKGDILEKQVEFAEQVLKNPKDNSLSIRVYNNDEALKTFLRNRNYAEVESSDEEDSELMIGEISTPILASGWTIRSMEDNNDIKGRCEVVGRAFDHTDPLEWPSSHSYLELQQAPDYRLDLDLIVVSPSGAYAACCIVWYDAPNRMAILEPVGTHPDYRGKGVGRAVVLEGLNRAKKLGAYRAVVGSGQEFYKALGFQVRSVSRKWRRCFDENS